MRELSPKSAASIANGVYLVRDGSEWDKLKNQGSAAIEGDLGISGEFTLKGDARFKGTSGGNLLRASSGFGFIAEGSGSRQGELLIATRGTVTALDWVTDAMQPIRRSSTGYAVHAGFQTTFESFLPDLAKVLNSGTRPTVVHAVGHSLGGALATLVADYASSRGIATKLYTFGAPRAGFEEFSGNLIRNMGAENIFRVNSCADPVTMVPIFPFCHAPADDCGYQLDWDGLPISFFAHKMGNYIRGVGDASWQGLKRAPRDLWGQADTWLEQASGGGNRIQMYSASSLRMIMKCLHWILEEVVGRFAGFTLLGAATVIDVMSRLLYQGVLQNVKMGIYVTGLINSILRFLGRTVVKGVSVTVSFISWVLNLLFGFISTTAMLALTRVI